MSTPAKDQAATLTWTSWMYGLAWPAAYLVVELSFCNQLIKTLGEPSAQEALRGLEFWGRVISGVGLGILLHRLVSPRLRLRALGFGLSLAVGIAVMWNVQRALIDHLVEVASPQDKRAALVLVSVAPHVGDAALSTLSGHPLVQSPPQGVGQNLAVSMFPAAALYADQRDQQYAQWLLQVRPAAALPTSASPPGDLAERADDAYRALIVAPLVIGLSLLFALLNFSLVVAFLLCLPWPRWRPYVVAAVWGLLVAVSLSGRSELLDAEGYERSLRPALWAQSPMLAVMLEWSTRTAGQWVQVSEFVHRHALRGYHFKPIMPPGAAPEPVKRMVAWPGRT